jgi:hypothetical protein
MAKLITPKKIDLILRLVDEDDDCEISSDQLLDMLIRVEKIFCQEQALD